MGWLETEASSAAPPGTRSLRSTSDDLLHGPPSTHLSAAQWFDPIRAQHGSEMNGQELTGPQPLYELLLVMKGIFENGELNPSCFDLVPISHRESETAEVTEEEKEGSESIVSLFVHSLLSLSSLTHPA